MDHGLLVSRLPYVPILAFGYAVYFDARPQCDFIRHSCVRDFECVEEARAGLIGQVWLIGDPLAVSGVRPVRVDASHLLIWNLFTSESRSFGSLSVIWTRRRLAGSINTGHVA